MSDKLPCCGNDKIILVDITDHFERKIECSECGTQYYQNKTTGELTKIGKKKKAPDMSDKRPWTPGPWLRHGSHLYDADKNIICHFASFGKWKQDNFQDLSDNLKLCQMAPEMAELLIDYVRIGQARIDIDIAHEELIEVFLKAIKLLKEIGYETPS